MTTKSIETLVNDIYDLFENSHTFSEESIQEFANSLANTITTRINSERGRPTLRLSNLGTPCERKLWYSINTPELGEPLPPEARIKFLFGDILEELLIFLTREAGHTVEGTQDELVINGVVGHRDGVVDGRLVDFKSASSFSFKTFENNELESPGKDAFGYLDQLNGYLHASKDDPLVKEHDVASFLVIDKQLGKITLDTYMANDKDYDRLAEEKREVINQPLPPQRGFTDIPDGKSGNMKLGTNCSYCEFKHTCWPNLQVYAYSTGPRFLTQVEKEPRVEKAIGFDE